MLKIVGKKLFYNFTLKFFVYLNLWLKCFMVYNLNIPNGYQKILSGLPIEQMISADNK